LNLIFPGQASGYEILQYLSISIPFIILAQTSTAILQGIGVYTKPVMNLAIGCIIKIVVTLSLVPVPDMNIYGAVIGTISGYLGASILNMFLCFCSRYNSKQWPWRFPRYSLYNISEL
jgi:stage V sporulation protein B